VPQNDWAQSAAVGPGGRSLDSKTKSPCGLAPKVKQEYANTMLMGSDAMDRTG